jgi:single-stranded DNA-specific DHH superfamily exonuclease
MASGKILDITFLTPNLRWEREILQLLDSTRRTLYSNSPLHVMAISIAIKEEHLRCFAKYVNKYARQANDILKRDSIETVKAIENNAQYSFKDVDALKIRAYVQNSELFFNATISLLKKEIMIRAE